MATKPTIFPTWATDANFSSGPENGLPTKIDPGAGVRAQGYIADEQVSSREWNHERNLIGQWIQWFDQERALSGLKHWTSLENDTSGLPASSFIQSIAYKATAGGVRWAAATSLVSPSIIYRSANATAPWGSGNGAPANIGGPAHHKCLIWSDVANLWVMGTAANASSPGGIMTSSDADTWTARTSHPTPASNSHFGLGENSTTIVATGDDPDLFTSTDGITWTSRTNPTANEMRAVAWSPTLSLFCAVGASGGILTSPTGTTWTARTSGTANELNDVLWEPVSGNFIACGAVGGTLIRSSDGITWAAAASPLDHQDLAMRPRCLATDGIGTVLAMGLPNGAALNPVVLSKTIDGGTTWTHIHAILANSLGSSSGNFDSFGLLFLNDRFVLVGFSGNGKAAICFSGQEVV